MSDDRSTRDDETGAGGRDTDTGGESAVEPALSNESDSSAAAGTDSEASHGADEREESTTAASGSPGDDGHDARRGGGSALSGTLGVAISALVGLAVTALSYWVVQGIGPFFERMPRVQPTVENRGVGSDWVEGNTDPLLDAMIALVHAADVLMGVFILVMVFLHWAAFRRLAARMRRHDERVVADGGRDDRPPQAAPDGEVPRDGTGTPRDPKPSRDETDDGRRDADGSRDAKNESGGERR